VAHVPVLVSGRASHAPPDAMSGCGIVQQQ
jgi:hypothetical protein